MATTSDSRSHQRVQDEPLAGTADDMRARAAALAPDDPIRGLFLRTAARYDMAKFIPSDHPSRRLLSAVPDEREQR